MNMELTKNDDDDPNDDGGGTNLTDQLPPYQPPTYYGSLNRGKR